MTKVICKMISIHISKPKKKQKKSSKTHLSFLDVPFRHLPIVENSAATNRSLLCANRSGTSKLLKSQIHHSIQYRELEVIVTYTCRRQEVWKEKLSLIILICLTWRSKMNIIQSNSQTKIRIAHMISLWKTNCKIRFQSDKRLHFHHSKMEYLKNYDLKIKLDF